MYNEEILALIRINRSANIKKAYELKQKEWTVNPYFNIFITYIWDFSYLRTKLINFAFQKFYRKIDFSDGELVTEYKLI
jgi:hypothetical protein